MRVLFASRLTSTLCAPFETCNFSQAVTGSRRTYHENIVDHYENPRNVGSLDKTDPNVGTVGECAEEVLNILVY